MRNQCVSFGRTVTLAGCGGNGDRNPTMTEREFFLDKLLVRVHSIIEMI